MHAYERKVLSVGFCFVVCCLWLAMMMGMGGEEGWNEGRKKERGKGGSESMTISKYR